MLGFERAFNKMSKVVMIQKPLSFRFSVAHPLLQDLFRPQSRSVSAVLIYFLLFFYHHLLSSSWSSDSLTREVKSTLKGVTDTILSIAKA